MADRPTHRFVAAVCAAHRDDGGDACGASQVDIDDSTPNRWQVRPVSAAGTSERTDQRGGFSCQRPWSAAAPCASPAGLESACNRRPHLGNFAAAQCVVIRADSSLGCAVQRDDGFDVDTRRRRLAPSVAALAALASPGSVSRLSGVPIWGTKPTALSTEIQPVGGHLPEAW